MADDKNSLYWAYNLPLQVWPEHEADDESKPVIGTRIVNYMPRKEQCVSLDLAECIGDQTREEFFETAALYLENLAALMRRAANDDKFLVYYHDKEVRNG